MQSDSLREALIHIRLSPRLTLHEVLTEHKTAQRCNGQCGWQGKVNQSSYLYGHWAFRERRFCTSKGTLHLSYPRAQVLHLYPIWKPSLMWSEHSLRILKITTGSIVKVASSGSHHDGIVLESFRWLVELHFRESTNQDVELMRHLLPLRSMLGLLSETDVALELVSNISESHN